MDRKILALTVLTALSFSSATAFGQSDQEEPLTAADDVFTEEIVVTARKRVETLQDVPFSVAARTENQMREDGLTSLEDISRTVASFSVQNLGPGQSVIAIRGSSAGKQDRDLPGIKEQVGVSG
jgi:iron complex outermembrane receptor protein